MEGAWEKALVREDLEVVRKLAKRSPEPLQFLPKQMHGWIEPFDSPLTFAVERDMHGLVAMLIEMGVDVGARTKGGQTAMHFVRSGNMVTRLLEAGLRPDTPDHGGKTPLNRLPGWSKDASRGIARRLIDAGAELELLEALEQGFTAEAMGQGVEGGDENGPTWALIPQGDNSLPNATK